MLPTAAPTAAPTTSPTPAPTTLPTTPPTTPQTTLSAASLTAEAVAFSGSDGAQAVAVAQRVLAAAPAAVRAVVVVRPGIEIRATGALDLAVGWHLGLGLGSAGTSAVASQLPSLTLRAAGDLTLGHSLSSGLDSSAAAAAGAMPSVPLVAQAGALRLVAGADLTAALPTAVLSALATAGQPTAGRLTVGRTGLDDTSPAPAVVVANSTGRIDLEAAGDIRLLNNAAAVYTTGRAAQISDKPLAQAVVSALAGTNGQLLTGGGAIGLQAGGNITGVPAGAYITDWWWRTETGAWYARYADLYRSGVATFGGGDITVRAAGSIRNLDLAAANSGLAASTDTTAPRAALVLGGGSVDLQAGGDIASGLVSASGARLTVRAGGAITAAGTPGAYEGLQLDYQATAVRVEAPGSVLIGSVKSAGRLQASPDNNETAGTYLAGLDNGASLLAASWGGDLRYLDQRQGSGRDSSNVLSQLIPGQALFTAPAGSVQLGSTGLGVVLRPTRSTDGLRVLAGQAVTLHGVTLQPLAAALPITVQSSNDGGQSSAELLPSVGVPLATGTTRAAPAPLQVVAQHGDLDLVGVLQAASPVRLLAGQDLRLDAPTGGLLAVHGAATDLSLLQAGRDIVVDSPVGLPASAVALRGAGDLVLLAGRQLRLGSSFGVLSRGNLDDTLGLAEGGASITAVAGTSAAAGDILQATRRGFVLLGGGGVASHAADLAAWLAAAQAGTVAPAVGSAASAQFAALAPGAQLDQVRSLLGTAAFEAALQRQLVALGAPVLASTSAPSAPGSTNADTTAAQARARFDLLPKADQARLVGELLATGFDRLAAAQQQALVLALAAQAPAGYATALTQFITARTGSPPANLAAALQAFQALPAEQQLLRTGPVLADALRAAGRAATAAAAGDARLAAYAQGYAALAAVFPGVRSAGSIDMTASQIKTLQGGDITMLTPGGGVTAGALTGGAAGRANSQGIVTVAGGSINAAVRDDFAVNQSRVFTLAQGDVLLWSSEGNLDAGKGAKTVRGAPKPVYGLDANGRVTVDTAGAFTGSGIAVLDAASTLDLFAPKGEINAGEAGIKSAGTATLGAVRFAGLDNVKFGGPAVGVPPPPPSVGATAGLAAIAQSAASTTPRDTSSSDDGEAQRKKKKRRNLLLDFLGFGQGD